MIGLDVGYVLVYLNKVCVYFLLDDIFCVCFYVEMEVVVKVNVVFNCFVNIFIDVEILGVLLLNVEGNKFEVIVVLKKIMDKDDENSIVVYNLMKLDFFYFYFSVKKGRVFNIWIDGVKDGLNIFWLNWELDYDFEKELNGGICLVCWSGYSEVVEVKEVLIYLIFFVLYFFDWVSDIDFVFLYIINFDYMGIFRKNMRKFSDNMRVDIKVGFFRLDLVDVFWGDLDKVIGLFNGEMMIYRFLVLFV